jgi:hypothetical protein
MLRRHHLVVLAMHDQERHGRQLADHVDRPVAVADGQAERYLEGPTEPETGQLLPGQCPIAGERTLDDQRLHLLAPGRGRERRDRE